MMEEAIQAKQNNRVAERRSGKDVDEAFAALFHQFYKPLFRFFLKRGFPTEESQDLTQETFIRVYKGMDSFRGDAPLEAWVFQIATNTFRNALRDRATKKRGAAEVPILGADEDAEMNASARLVDTNAPDPLHNVLAAEGQRVLREAVSLLPDQMRRCMTLRVYQQLSYQEIATVMRLSIETVKAHLFQARKQLRPQLEPYFRQLDF